MVKNLSFYLKTYWFKCGPSVSFFSSNYQRYLKSDWLHGSNYQMLRVALQQPVIPVSVKVRVSYNTVRRDQAPFQTLMLYKHCVTLPGLDAKPNDPRSVKEGHLLQPNWDELVCLDQFYSEWWSWRVKTKLISQPGKLHFYIKTFL